MKVQGSLIKLLESLQAPTTLCLEHASLIGVDHPDIINLLSMGPAPDLQARTNAWKREMRIVLV